MERERIYHSIDEDEPNPETALDVKAILYELEQVIREFDLNVNLDDDDVLRRLLGEDDDDFRDGLVAFAKRYGIDPDQFFTRLNIPPKG